MGSEDTLSINSSTPPSTNLTLDDFMSTTTTGYSGSTSRNAGAEYSLVNRNGTGVIHEVVASMDGTISSSMGFILVIDGVKYPLYHLASGVCYRLWEPSAATQAGAPANSSIVYSTARVIGPLPFKSSWSLLLKNEGASAVTCGAAFYYTEGT